MFLHPLFATTSKNTGGDSSPGAVNSPEANFPVAKQLQDYERLAHAVVPPMVDFIPSATVGGYCSV